MSDQATRKRKYYSKFDDKWLQNEQFKNWLKKQDRETASCQTCNVKFTVKHDGIKAVNTHLNSETHKSSAKKIQSNQLLTAFMCVKGKKYIHYDSRTFYLTIFLSDTPEALNICKAEIVQVFHGVNHHLSYLSMDCGIKLCSKLYADSSIAKKQSCGRTKAERIVENILAPKSIEIVLNEMGISTDLPLTFSIATDASNKGNRKLYPIAVKYFSTKHGIRDRILDFYEDSKESSVDIFNKIIGCLKTHGLDMKNISAYSADNAPVNFGIKNSVFQKLTDIHPTIIKSNCNAHVIHNAGRHACKALSYDVENLVLKTYAEFSSSAKNVDKLKKYFDDFEMEFQGILRHVVTRWLSLFPAIERLIAKWPAIKQYFLAQGKDEVDNIVWKFIKCQQNELNDDLNDYLTLPECYLYFVHHLMNILTKSIQCLESEEVMSTDIHEIMINLKHQIQKRLDEEFYGSKVNKSLKHLDQYKRNKFEREAKEVYTRALQYFHKWYDFEKSPFQYFSAINLKNGLLVYKDVLKAAEAAKVDLNEDNLFEEITLLEPVLPQIASLQLRLDQKWVEIFNKCDNLKELPKLVGKILSVPISNAYVERVFSIMGNTWTDLRNRMGVEMVKAELLVKLNFDMNCQQFEKFLSQPEQSKLLSKVKSQEKYHWRVKPKVTKTLKKF